RNALKKQLEAFVGGFKAQLAIETVGVEARFVGGELDEATACLAAAIHRPLHHLRAQAVAALIGADMDIFEQAPRHAEARQAGNEADLERADDFSVALGDDEAMAGTGADGVEGG